MLAVRRFPVRPGQILHVAAGRMTSPRPLQTRIGMDSASNSQPHPMKSIFSARTRDSIGGGFTMSKRSQPLSHRWPIDLVPRRFLISSHAAVTHPLRSARTSFTKFLNKKG